MTTPTAPGTDHSGEVANRLNWLGQQHDDATKKEAARLAYEAASDPEWGAALIAKALTARRPHTEAEEAVRRVEGAVEWLEAADWKPGVTPRLATKIAVRRIRAALDPS